jgi:hypothetical protein
MVSQMRFIIFTIRSKYKIVPIFLCITPRRYVGEIEVKFHAFLTSALDR